MDAWAAQGGNGTTSTDAACGGEEHVAPTDVWTVMRSLVLMALTMGVGEWLGLGLWREMAWATGRALVQLMILGVVLVYIFGNPEPWIVMPYAVMMACFAAQAAAARPRYVYDGLLTHVLLVVCSLPLVTTVLTVALVLGNVHPVWTPQYLIPLLGMALGNTINAIALGMDDMLTELKEGRDRVEVLLSLGASRWEATHEAMTKALGLALMPTINGLAVIGLVSIPGMMTGQILGGNSPQDAARYQFVVLMMIAASSFFSVACSVVLITLRVVDEDGSVRVDDIRRSAEEPSFLSGAGARVALLVRDGASYCYRCCCLATYDEEDEDEAEEEADSASRPLLQQSP